jgi:Uma2 family endonuclease
MALFVESETSQNTPFPTLVDMASRFGPMPWDRIRNTPSPGTASEADAIELNERGESLCELVDGVLVDKVMGFRESLLAGWLVRILGDFIDKADLGIVLPPDAMMRLWRGCIRLPDVSFISWERLPNREIPEGAAFDAGPDLAVEVISPGNTREELERKLSDYFKSGVRLVWYIYPKRSEVHVFTAVDQKTVLTLDQSIDGGNVLPGFTLPLKRLFGESTGHKN